MTATGAPARERRVNPAPRVPGKDAPKAADMTRGRRTCAPLTTPGSAPEEGEADGALPGDTYLAVWPVLDPARTLAQLVAEAEPTLRLLLEQSGCRPIGPTSWHVTDDAVLPGAVDGLVLVARVPARRVDPDAPGLPEPDTLTASRTDLTARRVRVAELHHAGLSGSAIATRLGMHKRQVERDLATLKAVAA